MTYQQIQCDDTGRGVGSHYKVLVVFPASGLELHLELYGARSPLLGPRGFRFIGVETDNLETHLFHLLGDRNSTPRKILTPRIIYFIDKGRDKNGFNAQSLCIVVVKIASAKLARLVGSTC